MKYNFDQYVEQDPASVKWSRPDVIPMWIADMDFPAADEITEALVKRAEKGLYGYTGSPQSYDQAVVSWLLQRHECQIREEWLIQTAGVVTAVNLAIQAFTRKGDGITIQTPAYHPFFSAIENHGRSVLENKLVEADGRYTIDYADLEEKLKVSSMLILCNPHNPTGRVFTKQELLTIAELCLKYEVFVFSDEIHQDLVYHRSTHIPYITLGEKYTKRLVTATAPSKTFNLAGLSVSNCIIPDEAVRRQFQAAKFRNGPKEINLFGLTACEAAYTYGQQWLDEVLVYLDENRKFARTYLESYLPGIKSTDPEGTYFLWLDCRALGLDPQQLMAFFLDQAKVYLNDGTIFGAPGFVRMNFACRRAVLEQALTNIRNACKTLPGQRGF